MIIIKSWLIIKIFSKSCWCSKRKRKSIGIKISTKLTCNTHVPRLISVFFFPKPPSQLIPFPCPRQFSTRKYLYPSYLFSFPSTSYYLKNYWLPWGVETWKMNNLILLETRPLKLERIKDSVGIKQTVMYKMVHMHVSISKLFQHLIKCKVTFSSSMTFRARP